MKKIKTSPGQISIFGHIIYGNKIYNSLKDAMLCAMQDFYIKKVFPAKIISGNKTYYLRDMKEFWNINGFHDYYIY